MRKRALLSRNEEGMVLALCLITLIVLSLIGVAATTTSRLEVEIAGNDKTAKEAFYAAELALTVGETVVEKLTSRAEFEEDKPNGQYSKLALDDWRNKAWDSTDSAKVATVPAGLKVSPRYIVGEWTLRRDSYTTGFGVQRGVYEFDVTALGTGSSVKSQAILQSVYAKRYN